MSGNLITTGQTLQAQITSNDSDISTLTTNLGTTGQTLQTQITSNDSDISTLQNLTGDYLTEESLSGTYSTQFDITVQYIGGGNRYLLSEVTDGSAFTTSQ